MSKAWTVTNFGCLLDGGSIVLGLRDPTGQPHSLHLFQHHLPTSVTQWEPPGALILDGEVLSVRGSAEADLIAALRSATYAAPDSVEAIDQELVAVMRQIVERVVSFVESDEYLDVARRDGRLP